MYYVRKSMKYFWLTQVGARTMTLVRERRLAGWSHIVPGGPMGPRSVLFFRKYFSTLARICLP